MKTDIAKNIGEEYGIDLKAMARKELQAGIKILHLPKYQNLLGKSYVDEVNRILGNAPANLKVTCSLTEEKLKEINLNDLNTEIEMELRDLFKSDMKIDLDFISVVIEICKSSSLELKNYRDLYYIYTEMGNKSGFEKIEITNHIGKIYCYCLEHGLNIKKVLFHGVSKKDSIYDIIMHMHHRLFFFCGINHDEEIKNLMLNEYMCDRNFRPERTAMFHMLKVIPWKKKKIFFKKRYYEENNIRIQLLDDLGEIMITGFQNNNCLSDIETAIRFLKDEIQLLKVKRNGATTLATIILKNNTLYLGMADGKGNAKSCRISSQYLYELIIRIIKDENLPYEVHFQSFNNGGIGTNEFDEVDDLIKELSLNREWIDEKTK